MHDQLTDELTLYCDRLSDCVGLVNAVIFMIDAHPLLPNMAVDRVSTMKARLDDLKTDLLKTINIVNQDLLPF